MNGVYHHFTGVVKKDLQRRCSNCKRKGHRPQQCPEPKKAPVCFLCGDPYHSGYSCDKSVCLKCGVFAAEGECVECYYHTFQYDTLCERCGSALHRTPHCPDSWRSFHATIKGELKVPEVSRVNQRKCCCNCARWGHFSHNCPTCHNTGQQASPFVTNYSNSPLQDGSTDIFISNRFEEIINSPEADEFFQNLSNMSRAQIKMSSVPRGIVLTINGTFDQCINVRSEIEEYVNTKKRKRFEPNIKIKRRRLK